MSEQLVEQLEEVNQELLAYRRELKIQLERRETEENKFGPIHPDSEYGQHFEMILQSLNNLVTFTQKRIDNLREKILQFENGSQFLLEFDKGFDGDLFDSDEDEDEENWDDGWNSQVDIDSMTD